MTFLKYNIMLSKMRLKITVKKIINTQKIGKNREFSLKNRNFPKIGKNRKNRNT